MLITGMFKSGREHDRGRKFKSSDAKTEKQATLEKSNMSLVKPLPKAFLALGTNYGIDCPYLYFSGNSSVNPPWNSAFSFCVITDSRSGEWHGIARAAGGELGNHRFMATYLNPPFLGENGFLGARARVRSFFYHRQHRLPKTYLSGQVKAHRRKLRSDHQDDH